MKEENPIKKFYEEHYARLELTPHMQMRIKLTEEVRSYKKNEKTIIEIGYVIGDN